MVRNNAKKPLRKSVKRNSIKRGKQNSVWNKVAKKSPKKNKTLFKVKRNNKPVKSSKSIKNRLNKGNGIKSFLSHILLFDKNKKSDKILLTIFIFLVLVGILLVLDTSLVFAKRDFHNAYHFFILQSLAALVGLGGFLVAYFIDYRIIKKFILPLFLITLGLLISTLFTKEVNGARSWISLGGFNLQPSEVAKLTFVLYISGILAQPKKWTNLSEFIKEDVLRFVLPLGVILLFVLGGKDLGTSIIIVLVALIIYFFKASTRYEYVTAFVMLIVFAIGGIGMIAVEGYRGDRVKVFESALTQGKIVDEQGSGYQMKQILLALGSGGLTGVGLAESLQKYDLVETTASTDSVIAIIAEEFGFIGAITTLGVFLLYVYRGLNIVSYNKDRYGQIVAVGIVSWIGVQVFVHVASNTAVTPLTGVPMPFLSYGGSSLVSTMIASGILLNISKK